MKVWRVEVVRRYAVVLAETPEEAISRAVEQGLVGDWEVPQAIEVSPPKDCRIIYDPQQD